LQNKYSLKIFKSELSYKEFLDALKKHFSDNEESIKGYIKHLVGGIIEERFKDFLKELKGVLESSNLLELRMKQKLAPKEKEFDFVSELAAMKELLGSERPETNKATKRLERLKEKAIECAAQGMSWAKFYDKWNLSRKRFDPIRPKLKEFYYRQLDQSP
jgi:hypothetical protein